MLKRKVYKLANPLLPYKTNKDILKIQLVNILYAQLNEKVRTGGTDNGKTGKKFKSGAIDASIWKNQLERDGKEFEVYSVSIERRFKDKDDI